MNMEYKKRLSEFFRINGGDLELLLKKIVVREIPSKTILLSEGEMATKLFLVIRGCLRTFFIKENGSEITSQFFIENQMVASFESAMTGTPSRSHIEAIEDSTIGIIKMKDLENLIMTCDPIKKYFIEHLRTRLMYYMHQHASFILDSPEKRYVNLVKERPDLVSRLPQQYIASYLGITPVSLSRIRARLKRINKS